MPSDPFGPLAEVRAFRLPGRGDYITLSVYRDGLGPRVDPAQFQWLIELMGGKRVDEDNDVPMAERLNEWHRKTDDD